MMFDQIENTCTKRHTKYDDEPQSKHQKLDSNATFKITEIVFVVFCDALIVFDGTYPHVLVLKIFKSKFSHHVDRYLNQYCAEYLSSLLFHGRSAFFTINSIFIY